LRTGKGCRGPTSTLFFKGVEGLARNSKKRLKRTAKRGKGRKAVTLLKSTQKDSGKGREEEAREAQRKIKLITLGGRKGFRTGIFDLTPTNGKSSKNQV